MKLFFGYRKYDSVTQALFETRVPSFETVLHMRVVCFVLNGLLAVTE